MKVTLKDVAAQAGVSKSLVSMYLNNDPRARLTKETCKKIDEVIRATGYRPSHTARMLRKGRTKTLGMVLGGLTDPFFYHLAEAVLRRSSKRGYQVLLSLTEWDLEQKKNALRLLLERDVDAIIYPFQIEEVSEIFENTVNAPPCVIQQRSHLAFNSVEVDMKPLIQDMALHFKALGAEEVGVFERNRHYFDLYRTIFARNGITVHLPDETIITMDNAAIARLVLRKQYPFLYIASCWIVKDLLSVIHTEKRDYHPRIVTNYHFPGDFIDDARISGIIYKNFERFACCMTDLIINQAENRGPVIRELFPAKLYPYAEFLKIRVNLDDSYDSIKNRSISAK